MTTANDDLSVEEHALLSVLPARSSLIRPGFRGYDFKLGDQNHDIGIGRMRFSEELVLGMVAKGLLRVNQAARPVPERTDSVPFSVIISKAGLETRARILDGRIKLSEAA
jgi:hypothetical protein